MEAAFDGTGVWISADPDAHCETPAGIATSSGVNVPGKMASMMLTLATPHAVRHPAMFSDD